MFEIHNEIMGVTSFKTHIQTAPYSDSIKASKLYIWSLRYLKNYGFDYVNIFHNYFKLEVKTKNFETINLGIKYHVG